MLTCRQNGFSQVIKTVFVPLLLLEVHLLPQGNEPELSLFAIKQQCASSLVQEGTYAC